MYGYIYRISFPTSSGIKYYYGKHKFSSEDNYYYGSSKIGQNWLKSKITLCPTKKDIFEQY